MRPTAATTQAKQFNRSGESLVITRLRATLTRRRESPPYSVPPTLIHRPTGVTSAAAPIAAVRVTCAPVSTWSRRQGGGQDVLPGVPTAPDSIRHIGRCGSLILSGGHHRELRLRAHANRSGHDCHRELGATSRRRTAAIEQAVITGYIAAGYTLVVPDYEGEHLEWTTGRQSAYAALDGIRAAQTVLGLPPSTPVGLIGYSGGSVPHPVGRTSSAAVRTRAGDRGSRRRRATGRPGTTCPTSAAPRTGPVSSRP